MKRRLRINWELFKVFLFFVVFFGAAIYGSSNFISPAPPHKVRMVTGGPNGMYQLLGKQYRKAFAQENIDLELVTTSGSVKNLALLNNPDNDIEVGFVQSGLATSLGKNLNIESLGSLYFEPLWVFTNTPQPLEKLSDLTGKRLAVGGLGSGTQAVISLLLKTSNLENKIDLRPVGGLAAATLLRTGQVDAVAFVGSGTTGAIKNLLDEMGHNPAIKLMNFRQANAYQRRFWHFSIVTIPPGLINLEQNIPAQTITLLAPTANLVVKKDVHPVVVDLLLLTMEKLHAGGDIFSPPGLFPNDKYSDIPVSTVAEHFFKNGPSFLQRYLPFWAASLLDRIKLMVLPLLVLLFPLFKIMPPTYRWRIRRKIYRWYKALGELEETITEARTKKTLEECGKALKAMEQDVAHINVPLSYADNAYHLRVHIDLVEKKRQQKLRAQTAFRAAAASKKKAA